jgi:hypothetical protein
MKPIRLSAHALSYSTKRGFTVAEVEDAIWDGRWEPAELGRMECRKTFAFNGEWNKKFGNCGCDSLYLLLVTGDIT